MTFPNCEFFYGYNNMLAWLRIVEIMHQVHSCEAVVINKLYTGPDGFPWLVKIDLTAGIFLP
jgi:hypothetical protein